jgi:FkbM family methyltransferase
MADRLKSFARQWVPRRLRNALRAPGATAGLWWKQRREVTHSPRPGWTLRCPLAAVDGAFHLQHDDPEQAAEFDEFLGVIRPLRDPLFFDLGCHFGLFSFAVAHHCGPGARCVAVDPSGTACRMVERIRDRNGWTAQIEVRQAAAGDRLGELELVDAGAAAAGYFVPPQDQPAADRARVPMLTVDELARQAGRPPSVLKVDVESYEHEVLAGAAETLARHPVALCLELHNDFMRRRGVDPTALLQRLAALGYREFQCAGRPISPAAILARPLVRVVTRRS